MRPRIVVFDVFETLMSLEPLQTRFTEAGLGSISVDLWFSRMIRDGMALTLAGGYAPFLEVAASALRTLSRGTIAPDAVSHVLSVFGELPPQPDAAPAMRLLADAGISMACLSNGAVETTGAFLQRESLDTFVDRVVSVSDVGQWKPGNRIYPYALEQVQAAPAEAALVAVHAFDIHGAATNGMTTGWASRLEGHYADVFAAPDVTGADLVEVAQQLIELPLA